MLDIGKKLRDARRHHDMSLRELAAAADVSASLLSQIENGKTNPSVMSLYNIAAALSLPMDYFFPDIGPQERENGGGDRSATEDNETQKTASEARLLRVEEALSGGDTLFDTNESDEPLVRRDARATIELMGGVAWERLTPGPEDSVEFLEVCYDVESVSGPAMSRHAGREFGFILEGELTLELAFERYVLHAGDSIIFDSATPHRLINSGDVPMRAIWVVFDYR